MTMPEPPRATVLIVDDYPNNIHLLGAMLREAYRILYATSGPEALGVARDDNPDLILLDIHMPDMDGFQVCAHLKADESTRGIPVILVTGADDTEAAGRGLACGAVAILTKPVTPEVVQAWVRAHLRSRWSAEAGGDQGMTPPRR